MRVINDAARSIEVMLNVGSWMKDSGLNPGEWWAPENMNKEYLFQHTEPEEYFCLLKDDKPAASVILQETERNQSWKAVDGDKPEKALYVHWLCVHRDFSGQGVAGKLIEFAKDEAVNRGFDRLRLDTDAEEKKLCALYEGLGFKRVGTEKEESHVTAFYEMYFSILKKQLESY